MITDKLKDGEKATKMVRFRTLGCYPLTGAVKSGATSIEEIVLELFKSTLAKGKAELLTK